MNAGSTDHEADCSRRGNALLCLAVMCAMEKAGDADGSLLSFSSYGVSVPDHRILLFYATYEHKGTRMKTLNKVELGGGFAVARRVYYRKRNGKSVQEPSDTFSLIYRDDDGKLRTESLNTTSQAEAIDLGRERIRERSADTQSIDPSSPLESRSRITLIEAVRGYREFCAAKGLTPKTLAKYKAETDRLLKYAAINSITHLDQLDERAYYGYGAWMRDREHKQHRTYSSKSVHTASVVMKQFLRHAHRLRLIEHNPLESASTPKAQTRKQPCPSPDQAEMMAAALDTPYREAVLILFYTGMRVGELLALRWSDVLYRDSKPMKIHIQRGGSADTTKDKDSRLVPVHPRIVDVIKGLDRSHPTVMPPMRDRMILLRVKRAAEEAGIEGCMTTHALRHGFASLVVTSGVPYRIALEWMGHSSSRILEGYITAYDRSSEHAMQLMAEHTQRVWGAHQR